MNLISTRTINQYAAQYPAAAQNLYVWVKVVKKAQWTCLNDVKESYPRDDLVGDDRLVFNIKGNHYRLIVRISFQYKNIKVKWFGPHKDYDNINARTV